MSISQRSFLKSLDYTLKKLIICTPIVLIILISSSCQQGKTNLRFAVLGHLYPLWKSNNHKALMELTIKINSEKPDLVFILGDSDVYNKEVYDFYEQNIKSKIIYAIGNHDFDSR